MDTMRERRWALTDVTLVIKGRNLLPEETTPVLGLEPTGVRNPGPGKWDPPGELDGRWEITCNERTTRDFHQQLDYILSIMENKQNQLTDLTRQGHTVSISLFGFSANDATLSLLPEEVKRIAILGFPLEVRANMNER